MEKPTIVTAFFDIKRGEWSQSKRGNDEYLIHFSSWARIKNKLIVYTDEDTAKKVKKIREQYGLAELTEIIVINDFKKIDFELLKSIKHAMDAPHAKQFHLKPDHPESWNAVYNYVMMLKWWCVCDAIARGMASGLVAWIDFGFNKGGNYYINPREFNFCWEVTIEKKIHLFSVNDFDDIPIYEIIQRMDTYIQGCNIIAPADLWPEFWRLIRESMVELNHCGLADDDQVLMLMAYRKKPELFNIIKCPWFGIFTATGVEKLTLRENLEDRSFKGKLKNKIKKLKYEKLVKNYIKSQKKILIKRNTISD